jgi:hypothetical protein
MRAEAPAMPNEDAAMVATRVGSWNDCYRSRSPAAQHLVNECVAATLLSDRCRRAYDAAVADQVDEAARDWERGRAALVDDTWKGLASDPGDTVAALERTGHGCRWLTSRWERLGTRLKLRGGWDRADCDEAVRLCSARPTPEGLRDDLTAYVLVLCNLRCRSEPSDEPIAAMLAPGRRPAELEGRDPSSFVFERATCLKLLGDLVLEKIDLAREAERRAEASDATSRSRALNRAMVLRDGAEARLFFRHQAESRSTFHRAYRELLTTLERDDAAQAAAIEDVLADGADIEEIASELVRRPSTAEAVATPGPLPEVRDGATSSKPSAAPERGEAIAAALREGGDRATAVPPGLGDGEARRGGPTGQAPPPQAQGRPAPDAGGPRLVGPGAYRDILEFNPRLRDQIMRGRPTFPR